MIKALKEKFDQNKDLGEILIAISDAILREKSPADYFWGLERKKMG